MDDDPADGEDIPEKDTRTPAWYWSRLELGVGVVLVLLIALIGWYSASPCFGCDMIWLGPLRVSERVVGTIVALPLAILGLIWMVRILRFPRDEPPPPWRYRDR